MATDEFIVVGSQSVLGKHPNPPASLAMSIEADLYPVDDPSKSEILSATIGEDSHFHDTFGVYADGVSETTSTLPDGWRDRLIKLQNENTGGAIAWCIDPTDLAIAKHVAGREKDLEFTAAMVQHGIINHSAFLERLHTLDLTRESRERILTRFTRQVAGASKD
ncbi:MAG: hypothetical protein F4Y01_07140 [Gammaproteobacteria bacterium]|nr:hypothetical protein [Gammaproteobacteria bacterium]